MQIGRLWLGFWLAAGLGTQAQAPAPEPASTPLQFQKVFHMAGLSGVSRNAHVDAAFMEGDLVITHRKKPALTLPYPRMRKVQLFPGGRVNPGAMYAGALAAGVLGVLLTKKAKPVDVLVLEFANERGGLMGVVLQFPEKSGPQIKAWLEKRGVEVQVPEPPAPAPSPKDADKK